jgi:hypothetical protein
VSNHGTLDLDLGCNLARGFGPRSLAEGLMARDRGHSSRVHPGLDRKPGTSNWVDAAGGLPSYIERIAKHLHYDKGFSISRAIATAVSRVKVWAAGGDNVSAATQAKAAKALAEWNRKKAKSAGGRGKGLSESRERSLAYKPGGRQFDNSKHIRVGGRFAPKGATVSGGVRTSQDSRNSAAGSLANLPTGKSLNIEGINGRITKTAEGYVIYGPDGFKETASSVTSALAVAARLVRRYRSKQSSTRKVSTQ